MSLGTGTGSAKIQVAPLRLIDEKVLREVVDRRITFLKRE